MGWGDEIMAAGEARRAGGAMILDWLDRPRWHPLWDHCPDVHRDHAVRLRNGGRARPYIAQATSTRERWDFRPYAPFPARVAVPETDIRFASGFRGCVVVEPNLKPGASPNKDWGFARWQAVVNARPDLRWVQPAPADSRARLLTGVAVARCETFVQVLALLGVARAAVLPEGGLHHGAAAMACPAVVIYGGYIGPHVTGYAGQRALYTGSADTLGWRIPRTACAEAMDRIRPADVLAELEAIL